MRSTGSLTENAPLVDHLGFDACGPEGPPKPSDYRIGSLKLTATES